MCSLSDVSGSVQFSFRKFRALLPSRDARLHGEVHEALSNFSVKLDFFETWFKRGRGIREPSRLKAVQEQPI